MKILPTFIVMILIALSTLGQSRLRNYQSRSLPERTTSPGTGEFTFARIIYSSPFRGRGRGSWSTDFPDADYHFIEGVRLWAKANLDISPKPVQIPIMDDKLFSYPLIYFVEPGFMGLSDVEAQRLREFALRGGFLFLDDFWGDREWENVRLQMQKIFPKYVIEDLPLKHPVFHAYFDIDEVVQVPGIGPWLSRGITYEKGGTIPHYMGIHDERGRLVVFIARNCDLGDAWEWINDPRYPMKYGMAAYRLGINVIIYAMTH